MTSLASIGIEAASLAAIVLCAGCGARSELDSAAATSGACPPSPTPHALFTADYLADELTGDGDRVFALSIQEIPGYSTDLIESIDPCTGDAVSLGEATPFDANDPAVVAVGGIVYWVTMGSPPGPAQTLQRAPAAGGTATTVLQTGAQVESLAVAAGTFFGVGFEGEDLALFSLPLAGGARTALASDAYYVNPIVDGSIVYYAGGDSGIGRVTTTGEPMPALPPAEQVFCGNGESTLRSMAADAEAIYTFTREAFHLWRVPKDGSAPTLLTTSTSCSQIVLDDAYVYFSSPGDGGGILRVPKAGGAVETVAPETEPGNIVVDANSVYWVHDATAVMKLDK